MSASLVASPTGREGTSTGLRDEVDIRHVVTSLEGTVLLRCTWVTGVQQRNTNMSEQSKETVIIVHGTWGAPDPGKRRWYEPVDGRPGGEQFTSKLDAALHERGSPARCWANCSGARHRPILPTATARPSQFYWWPGENSWIARTRAAIALGEYVNQLQKGGWLCHIVAHSHGGNVLLEALPLIASPVTGGKLVTLGTPFMDIHSPILQRRKRFTAIARDIPLFILVLLVFLLLVLISPDNWSVFGIIAALTFLALIARLFLGRHRVKRLDDGGVGERSPSIAPFSAPFRRTPSFLTPQLLAISSGVDEAWQILHHVRTGDNPPAMRTKLKSYLASTFRSYMARTAEIELILGAKPFVKRRGNLFINLWTAWNLLIVVVGLVQYLGVLGALAAAIAFIVVTIVVAAAFYIVFRELGHRAVNAPSFAPLRWCGRLMGAVSGVLISVLFYLVRRNAWPILQAIVMGLEGYRFELPSIARKPDTEYADVSYEDLPDGAAQRALDRRSAWIARHLGDVSQTFSRLAVTAADITSLLRMIEDDQTLVHAAYYTDDECIARIADWIAGKG
jgi:hypothetical protein